LWRVATSVRTPGGSHAVLNALVAAATVGWNRAMRKLSLFGTGVALTCAVALGAAGPATAAAPAGTLTRVPGPAGCVTRLAPDAACTALRPPGEFVADWVFSPDGRQALGTADVIPILDVDEQTGKMRQPAGPDGCLGAGCATDLGLTRREFLSGLAFSPAGDRLYALIEISRPRDVYDVRVLAWSRDPVSGALRRFPEGRGCLAPSGVLGCAAAPELAGADGWKLRVAPDGRSLTILGQHLVTVPLDAEGALTTPISSCHAAATMRGTRRILPCGPSEDTDLRHWFRSDELRLSPDGTHAYLEQFGRLESR